ncbi:MAG: hypothetical protein H0W52_08235 [Rubrobacteraceae bacterium]|nr:hypothetical protein [Rubrobacteraceae bacterium]
MSLEVFAGKTRRDLAQGELRIQPRRFLPFSEPGFLQQLSTERIRHNGLR